MNKKVYKMYEAPKMEIVEVELREGILETSGDSAGGNTTPPVEGGDIWGDDKE